MEMVSKFTKLNFQFILYECVRPATPRALNITTELEKIREGENKTYTEISANGASCARNSSDALHKRKKKWPRYFGNAAHCNATQSKIVLAGNDFLAHAQTEAHTHKHICVARECTVEQAVQIDEGKCRIHILL